METLTLSQALEHGYRWYGKGTVTPGYTIAMSKPKPFDPDEKPISWDRWGPRFAPMYDNVAVTLQNQEEVDQVKSK